MRERHLDVLVIPESKLPDHLVAPKVLREARLKIINIKSQDDSHRKSAQHGVAVLHRNYIKCDVLRADVKGMLSLRIRSSLHGDIAHVIAAYCPPSTSTYNDPLHRYTDYILQQIQEEYAHHKRRSTIPMLVIGDLNISLGPTAYHSTMDKTAKENAYRRSALKTLCKKLFIAPAHGFSSQDRAQNTSRPITVTKGAFTREVDYIMCDRNDIGERVFPRGGIAWNRIVSIHKSITHRPLEVVIKVSKPTQNAEQRPHATPRWRICFYSHHKWYDAASTLKIHFNNMAVKSSGHITMKTVQQCLSETMDKHFTNTPHRSNPCKRYRELRGMSVPLHLKRLLNRRRSLFRVLKRQHLEHMAEAHPQLLAINATIRSASQKYIRSAVAKEAHRYDTTRRIDSHTLFKELRKIMRNTPLLQPASSSDSNNAVNSHFAGFFKGLVHETRQINPGIVQRWAPHIPVATKGRSSLTKPVTWVEVYLVLYPFNPKLAHHFKACHVECKPCNSYADAVDRSQCWHNVDPDHPVPTWKPCVHTSTAAGPDNIPMELLRWSRPLQREERFNYRRRICIQLAKAMNNTLHGDTNMEQVLLEQRTISFPKRAPLNGTIDANDPDGHRGITMGNALAKVFGLVLCSRLTHFIELNGLISHSQIGFRSNYSIEHHLFTILETLKRRGREGSPTYVLFLDLKKAYDTVHLESLWELMKQMGFPLQFVSFLSQWSSQQHSFFCRENFSSEPYETTRGVPQGGVLSCLLFALYIEPLARALCSPDFNGVEIESQELGERLRIKSLLYADDIATLASSPEELQRALDVAQRWCADWQLQISVGTGKTEAMLVHPPGAIQSEETHKLLCGPSVVPWTHEYRYLGYVLRDTLIVDDMAKVAEKSMSTLINVHLKANRALRQASMATLIQVLNTIIIGSVQHLFSLVPFTRQQLNSMSSKIIEAAKLIIRANDHSSNLIAQALTRSLLAEPIQLQHRARLLWTLQLSPHAQGIAPRLHRILSTETVVATCPDTHEPWHTQANEHLNRARAEGITVEVPVHYQDIHRLSTCLGRSYSYAIWRRSSIDAAQIPANENIIPQRNLRQTPERQRQHATYSRPQFTDAPRTYSTIRHFAGMTGAHNRCPTELSHHSFTSPMHITGPGANGSIVALTDRNRREVQRLVDFQYGGINANIILFARDSTRTTPPYPCCFCGTTDLADLWHVLFVCSGAPAEQVSALLTRSKHTAINIANQLLRLLGTKGPLGRQLQVPITNAVLQEIHHVVTAAVDTDTAGNTSRAYCRATLYRVLTAFTWSDGDITTQSTTDEQDLRTLHEIRASGDTWKKFALALGLLFRHTLKFRNELRKTANDWARRSSHQLDSIVDMCRA
jgi:exonuclease III